MKSSKGSSIPPPPRIDKKQIMEFPITVFDMPTQKSIAQTLSVFDNKIDLNKKINTKLENLARDLYNYWFVQFDFPDKFGQPYKTGGGKMIWNAELKRKIPEGWEVGKIGNLYTENKKSKVKVGDAKNNKTGKYPFFTSGQAILRYDEYFVDSTNLFLNTGGNADIEYFKGKAAYSADTYSITSKYINYLHLFLLSRIPDINENYFAGSSLKHLQKNDFRNIRIVLPPKDLLAKFGKIVDVNISLVMKNNVENIHLASIRDFLLPMLMNGQVSIHMAK
ncbi:MAG: restriction endonuclease subunit S [Candidatus Ancillula trichonymphae]|jgi:type I restriction enzyme S subunit|nr:restriction endonuclease subunit S [Candidatus Ancillula trichonymphae]